MSENLKEYLRLQALLFDAERKGDEEALTAIADEMDPVWYMLTNDEQAQIRTGTEHVLRITKLCTALRNCERQREEAGSFVKALMESQERLAAEVLEVREQLRMARAAVEELTKAQGTAEADMLATIAETVLQAMRGRK